MNERTQKFRKSKDCKHSVVYVPDQTALGPDEPCIASSVYINRACLPVPVPDVVYITLGFVPREATPAVK